ncbi:MAG: RnfABCDGE type electron transport complex subunit D [Clostridia bacterium]|nr:RnfABCDGE type electron transport complex subunit D [Clostridia bacterium]
MKTVLNVTSSPHIRHQDTTNGIMLDVIIALLPAAVFGCILFGIKAVFVLITCIATAVLSEFLWNKILKKPNTIGDLSAVVTGLLLGMNLSSELPVWMAAIGSAVAIIVVKQMFGGIGCNFANPAIAARIVLLVSFPAAMTRFIVPVEHTMSSATPLVALSDSAAELAVPLTTKNLFFGMHSGCIGETSAFLLIIGGLYLVMRRVISPVTPISFVGTVALLSLISGENLNVAIFGGGLMLGAIFMATDYTTSPTTQWGKLIFGIGCGIITFVIRKFAAVPEGVSYAILIMNILVPYINRATLRKPFGYVKPIKVKEGKADE